MLHLITENNFNVIYITHFTKDRRGKNEDFVTFDVSTKCRTQTIPDKTITLLFKSHKILINLNNISNTGIVPGRRTLESRTELSGWTAAASAVRYFAYRFDDTNAEVTQIHPGALPIRMSHLQDQRTSWNPLNDRALNQFRNVPWFEQRTVAGALDASRNRLSLSTWWLIFTHYV